MKTRCNESIPLKILWIDFQRINLKLQFYVIFKKKCLKLSLCFFFRFLPCSLDSRISFRPRWQTYGFKNEKEEEETGERACVDVDYEETVPELADERSSAIRIPVTLGLYTRLETAITLQCCFEKPALNNYVYVLSLIWKAECFYKY